MTCVLRLRMWTELKSQQCLEKRKSIIELYKAYIKRRAIRLDSFCFHRGWLRCCLAFGDVETRQENPFRSLLEISKGAWGLFCCLSLIFVFKALVLKCEDWALWISLWFVWIALIGNGGRRGGKYKGKAQKSFSVHSNRRNRVAGMWFFDEGCIFAGVIFTIRFSNLSFENYDLWFSTDIGLVS